MNSNKCSFTYKNKNDFQRKLKSLKIYCPVAYKELIFNIGKSDLNLLANGTYSIKLHTSNDFKFVYGQIQFIFSVFNDNIIVEDILPQQFFLDGYYRLLNIYKGVPYRNEKDKFKIDLMLKMLRRDNYECKIEKNY